MADAINVGQAMNLLDRPPGRHSTLHAWLVQHYVELRDGDDINWRWLMGKIEEAKLTDRNGKPPTLSTAKQTMHRIRRAIEAGKLTPPKPAPPKPPQAPWRPSSDTTFDFVKLKG